MCRTCTLYYYIYIYIHQLFNSQTLIVIKSHGVGTISHRRRNIMEGLQTICPRLETFRSSPWNNFSSTLKQFVPALKQFVPALKQFVPALKQFVPALKQSVLRLATICPRLDTIRPSLWNNLSPALKQLVSFLETTCLLPWTANNLPPVVNNSN